MNDKEKLELLSEIGYRVSSIESLMINGKSVLAYFKVQGLRNYIDSEIKKSNMNTIVESIANKDKNNELV